jgi:hypothetical protein
VYLISHSVKKDSPKPSYYSDQLGRSWQVSSFEKNGAGEQGLMSPPVSASSISRGSLKQGQTTVGLEDFFCDCKSFTRERRARTEYTLGSKNQDREVSVTAIQERRLKGL